MNNNALVELMMLKAAIGLADQQSNLEQKMPAAICEASCPCVRARPALMRRIRILLRRYARCERCSLHTS